MMITIMIMIGGFLCGCWDGLVWSGYCGYMILVWGDRSAREMWGCVGLGEAGGKYMGWGRRMRGRCGEMDDKMFFLMERWMLGMGVGVFTALVGFRCMSRQREVDWTGLGGWWK